MQNTSGKKIIQKVEKYLNYLNPLAKNGNTPGEERKRSRTRVIEHNNIIWTDIENPSKADIATLSEEYNFHTLHLDACNSTGELDRIETEEKYTFVLLHSPNFDEAGNKVIADHICFFLGKNYLITVHGETTKTLIKTFDECEEKEETKDAFFKKSTGFLLYNIINALENDVSVLLQTILQELDSIEDLVFDANASGAFVISAERQKIVRLRRVVASFRNIVQGLSNEQNPLTSKTNRYFKKLTNKINKLWELLEEARETVEIYKDADFTVSAEKTNKILTVLTIIFTLSIPSTIIGSLYGMNVLIPGGIEAGSWTFLGDYTAFYLVLGISFLSLLIMLLYFKYKDWF